jgi:hypothetical protein
MKRWIIQYSNIPILFAALMKSIALLSKFQHSRITMHYPEELYLSINYPKYV